MALRMTAFYLGEHKSGLKVFGIFFFFNVSLEVIFLSLFCFLKSSLSYILILFFRLLDCDKKYDGLKLLSALFLIIIEK